MGKNKQKDTKEKCLIFHDHQTSGQCEYEKSTEEWKERFDWNGVCEYCHDKPKNRESYLYYCSDICLTRDKGFYVKDFIKKEKARDREELSDKDYSHSNRMLYLQGKEDVLDKLILEVEGEKISNEQYMTGKKGSAEFVAGYNKGNQDASNIIKKYKGE